MSKQIFASLMLGLATILWGLSYCVQTVSAADLQTFTVVFFKGVGAIFLIPLIIKLKQRFNRHTFIGGTLMGMCVFFGCAFQHRGMVLSTVSKASFITVLYIVIVPMMQLLLGKKIKRRMLMAILTALAGLYFLCISGNLTLNIGDLYLLIGAVFFALQILLIDHYVEKCDSVALCFVQQMVSSILAGIIMIFVERPQMSDIMNAFWMIMYIVIVSGAFAQTIQTVYQKYLDPSLASLIMSFESVTGAIFGWLILNQTLTIREIVGCVLVFIAILIAE